MKHDFKIFIGWDINQAEAAEVCAESIHRFTGNEVPINFIERDKLQMKGLYWRPHDSRQSTEFAFTRFLTPYLAGYHGTALFCDCDFFWRKDPRTILEYRDERKPVQVVQHNLQSSDINNTKMAGKIQTFYPKKNWSSLMLFNMDTPGNRLTCKRLDPVSVSEAPAHWLHGMEWCCEYMEVEHGGLPKSFNHLVGYNGYDDPDPAAVHFTDGGPWLGGQYIDQPFSYEWLALRDKAMLK
jgi:hypothetical protein